MRRRVAGRGASGSVFADSSGTRQARWTFSACCRHCPRRLSTTWTRAGSGCGDLASTPAMPPAIGEDHRPWQYAEPINVMDTSQPQPAVNSRAGPATAASSQTISGCRAYALLPPCSAPVNKMMSVCVVPRSRSDVRTTLVRGTIHRIGYNSANVFQTGFFGVLPPTRRLPRRL